MDFSSYVPVIGTIVNIARENDCCSRMISLNTSGGIVNFVVNQNTVVIDSRQLRTGMRVAAFYDSNLPVPLIFPPRYQAQLVTALGRNEQIMMNYFDRNLVATDQSLQIHPGRGTSVETLNGQDFNCNLGNQGLLVYYTETTRSIPPQTTPRRIVVLC